MNKNSYRIIKQIKGILGILLLTLAHQSCSQPDQVKITSPDGRFRFELFVEASRPCYRAFFNNMEIVGKSSMGFKLSTGDILPHNVEIKNITEVVVDDVWEPVYGEKNQYPETYRQALITFEPKDKKSPVCRINIRAYNEGLAFRYEIENEGKIIIEAERTEFALPGDPDAWVSIQAQTQIDKKKISELQGISVERPLLAQLNDSIFVALGEAALVDFARMKFVMDMINPSILVADLDGEVHFTDAFKSPWRTIMAGNSAGEILENNYLLLNLNAPNTIKNPDWIKPGKVLREVTLTTQGGMACVDFAVKHNIQYIEFDAGWYGNEYDDTSDATTITVDPKRSKGPLDLHQVIKYAESNGIGVILYINRRAMEKQLDEILPVVKSWGVKGLKYGFVQVGSQQWTSWLHEAVRKAAEYELMVDIHDEYRPTGYSRTYPNLMSQEGIRGDEESPDNTMVLKTLFARMAAGAGDHTSCYFAGRVDDKMGSHASQLAKTICIYSPWQFLYWYDRPEGSPHKTGGAGKNDNYIIEVPELIFFDQLPTVWDDTEIIKGYPGEFAVVARKSGTTWFVGALNGEKERNFTIPIDFLDPKINYEATIFTDNKEIQTPTKVAIKTMTVTSKDIIKKILGRHEGMAIIINKQ